MLMKNKIRLLTLTLAAAMLLASCSGTDNKNEGKESTNESATEAEKNTEIDLEATAKALSELKNYDDSMVRISDALAETRYVFAYDKAVIYAAEGIGADMVMVSEYPAKADAEDGKGYVEDYIKRQIDLYAGYKASEVPKLEKAYIEVKDKYLIVVVGSSTDGVKDIIG